MPTDDKPTYSEREAEASVRLDSGPSGTCPDKPNDLCPTCGKHHNVGNPCWGPQPIKGLTDTITTMRVIADRRLRGADRNDMFDAINTVANIEVIVREER